MTLPDGSVNVTTNHHQPPASSNDGPADATAMNEREHRRKHAAQDWFIRALQRAFVEHLLRLPLDSAAGIDDVRHLVSLPEGVHHNSIGTLTNQLRRAGVIEFAGTRRTYLKAGRGHKLNEWRLTSHAAGLDWLRTHPALPGPDDFADDTAGTPCVLDAKGDA